MTDMKYIQLRQCVNEAINDMELKEYHMRSICMLPGKMFDIFIDLAKKCNATYITDKAPDLETFYDLPFVEQITLLGCIACECEERTGSDIFQTFVNRLMYISRMDEDEVNAFDSEMIDTFGKGDNNETM